MSTEAADGLAPIEEPVETPVEETTTAAETHEEQTEDEKVEGAVEFKPGEKYVPLSAVIEARKSAKEAKERLKELEPASQEAQQLRQYLNDVKPYIEFLRANPDFLTRTAQPQAKQEPQVDAEAEETARDLELYTKDGTLDVAKARRILDRTAGVARQSAEKIAAQTTEPVAKMVESQKVLGVLHQLQQERDGDGQGLTVQAVNALAQDLVQTLGQEGARRFIAQDGSYTLLKNMAFGKQATLPKRAKVAPPAHDPLATERAGGRTDDVVVSTQHLGRLGISQDKYTDSAKRFKPGGFNSLE